MSDSASNLPILPRPLESHGLRIIWIDAQETNGTDNINRLRINIEFESPDGKWIPVKNGSFLTQVRVDEDKEILSKLLYKVFERVEPLCSAYSMKRERVMLNGKGMYGEDAAEVWENLQWLGPEFAEDY